MPKEIETMYSTAIPHRLAVAGGMVALLLDTVCSAMSASEQRTMRGGAIGAAAGAVLGAVAGESAIAGAIIVGAAGAAAGYLLKADEANDKLRR